MLFPRVIPDTHIYMKKNIIHKNICFEMYNIIIYRYMAVYFLLVTSLGTSTRHGIIDGTHSPGIDSANVINERVCGCQPSAIYFAIILCAAAYHRMYVYVQWVGYV